MISMILVRRSLAAAASSSLIRFPARRVWSCTTFGKMLIARAITMIAVRSDSTDSAIIAIFAHAWMGNVSVGLNAVAFVNER